MNAAIKKLVHAVAFVQQHYPLPRCVHGHALKDHAGDLLEPSCGCRLCKVCKIELATTIGGWCVKCASKWKKKHVHAHQMGYNPRHG